MPDEDEIRFARSGHSSPLGKYTAEVKSLIPEDTKEALTALAFANGKSVSEYVRFILMSHVHGYGDMLRLQHQSMPCSAGIGKV